MLMTALQFELAAEDFTNVKCGFNRVWVVARRIENGLEHLRRVLQRQSSSLRRRCFQLAGRNEDVAVNERGHGLPLGMYRTTSGQDLHVSSYSAFQSVCDRSNRLRSIAAKEVWINSSFSDLC